ncbi:NmrA family transcriptional regulator [Paraliobacillus quinghaiensis]|uniref:NmrA family transcriptional regulator n=1 Tax=Paraliobacillus quinghaiensis TaxID=470815 RepID=A0A917TFC5_9BACI|nr:NmrA family NAD(P)-binding protein [Paraliobacillus quinghaiensis]GGM20279.1 NmrA family transcriptional regulator [Paraliobacillus quinghaiensis]
MGKVLITGYTGNIGRYVVEGLLDKSVEIVCASRKADKRESISELQEVVPFDFLNSETFNEVLIDVDRVFLVRPPQLASPKKDMYPFLKYIKEKGIKHIVFVSLLGVEKNPIAPHRKIEEMIKDLHITYTFLRPSFFMQNLSTTHRNDILYRDEIAVPVGNAITSFVDTRDIADVATEVIANQDPDQNNIYTLTGDVAIDYYTVAEALSEVLERSIQYRKINYMKFRKETIEKGVNKNFANVMTMLYFITRMGSAKKVTNDIEQILKRKPTTFRSFAEDYKRLWVKN